VQDPNIEQLLGCPPRISHDAIRRHPRMPQARKLFLDRFLALYADGPFLVRLLIEMSRVALYQSITVLESAHHDARRETWLTVGLLKQLMTQFGLASGRQVDHLVGRLCAVGFMEQRPSAHDRRVRILAPTEKLRAHDRAWFAAPYACSICRDIARRSSANCRRVVCTRQRTRKSGGDVRRRPL
jgi:DNA-binding MarR family transcriptional regulator